MDGKHQLILFISLIFLLPLYSTSQTMDAHQEEIYKRRLYDRYVSNKTNQPGGRQYFYRAMESGGNCRRQECVDGYHHCSVFPEIF